MKMYKTQKIDSTNTQKILDAAKSDTPLTFLDKSTDGTKYYKSYVPFYLKGSSVVWLSGTSITKAEFDAQIMKQVSYIAIWLIVGFFALIGLAYFRITKSLRPISKLEQAIKELSHGNLHYELDYQSNDEFGSLADSLRTSTSILYAYVTDIDRAMSEMANGNFDLGAAQPFIGDFKNIEVSMDKFIGTMSATLLQIKRAADQVSSGSAQVSDGAQALAQSATEQASSVEVLSSEIADVSAHIKTTADNASGVNQLAGAEDITKLIAEISHASAEQTESIEEITMGIDQISSVVQTNSATSEESAAASEELSSQADMMKALVSRFKLKHDERQLDSLS